MSDIKTTPLATDPGSQPGPAPDPDFTGDLFDPDFKGSDHSLSQEIKTVQQRALNLGKYNGSRGIHMEKGEVEELAKAKAEGTHHDATIVISGEIKELEEKIKTKKKYYTRIKNELEEADTRYDSLTHTEHFANNNYGWFSICLLFLIGFFLILADIPLAVKLIQAGFGFDPPPEGLEFSKLVSRQFWHVLAANWEVFFTALGIAFCPIIIKIMYDEYVATPYGFMTLKRKSFYNNYELIKDKAMDKKDRSRVWREQLFKNSIRFIILAAIVYTIFKLGEFRVASMAIVEAKEDYRKDVVAANKLHPDNFGNLDAAIKVAEAKRNSILSKVDKEYGEIFPLTFTLITLIFPITSGICFSISLTGIYNKLRLNKLQKLKDEIRQRTTQAEDELSSLEGKLTTWVKNNEYFNNNWEKKFTDRLVTLYQSGFKMGSARPDLVYSLPGLMTLADNIKKRNIIRRVNLHSQTPKENGKPSQNETKPEQANDPIFDNGTAGGAGL